ncbi:MAG: serine hydrolase domain-containing protein, partial [Gaiellales bacterium]
MAHDPLELARALVDDGVVDALQIAYRRDGAVTAAQFGACTGDSRFALASLTKPLIAMACLAACDEGVLELDGPLAEHVPEAVAQTTLRELLSHASGLPADDAAARRVQLDPASTWLEVAAAYARMSAEVPARTRRIYSNAGYALAALMLERAAAMPYGDYVRAAVLE